jgi:hypothetical protein
MIRIWSERAAQRAKEEMEQWLDDAKEDRPHVHTMTLQEAIKANLWGNAGRDEEHVAFEERLRARAKELGVEVPEKEDESDE